MLSLDLLPDDTVGEFMLTRHAYIRLDRMVHLKVSFFSVSAMFSEIMSLLFYNLIRYRFEPLVLLRRLEKTFVVASQNIRLVKTEAKFDLV